MKSKLLMFFFVLLSLQTLQAQKKKIVDENGDTLVLSTSGDTIIKHCYILTKDMFRDYQSGKGILIYKHGRVTKKTEDILKDSLYSMTLNRDIHVALFYKLYERYEYLVYLTDYLEEKIDSLQNELEIANIIQKSQEKQIIEKDNVISELNKKIHRRRRKIKQ